jgi:hypothetical protein
LVSLSQQVEVSVVDESPRLALAPSAARVEAIDQGLRARLAGSFRYLADFAGLDDDRRAAFANLEKTLGSGPVSPWVFGLYAKLVAALAAQPRGDVIGDCDAVLVAARLPADLGVVALRDPGTPARWWDHFRLLFDTDHKRPFHPQAPTAESFARCRQDIEQGLELLQRGDPVWHEEVSQLLRLIVLGAPASAEISDLFNGASTFFLWGATLINADAKRGAVSMADLLVHESSHGMLFGFSAEGALTQNRGDERYTSPLRKDARPIDGIFHACFVATRVHLAMSRMLDSGRLTAGEETKVAERRNFNGNAAHTALEVLAEHAKLTKLGNEILGTIRDYWAAAPAD